MGTTTTLPTESESRLAGTEQVGPPPGSWRAIAWEDRYPLDECGEGGGEPRSYWWINRDSAPHNELAGYMSEADARLIAAAPDMLAALKALAHLDERCGWHSAALDQAHAAISKAEGRTP